MNPKDRFIDVRGLKIHYVEWGNRSGEPLILIHGFLDHARSWDPFVAAMRRKAEKPSWIIVPDCRGHGDSGWVGAGGYYHFADYLFDLDSLIRTLGTPTVNLMGHSMGGTISFLYTGTFPKTVKKLVLVEGVGPPGLNFSDAPPRVEKWLGEMRALARSRSKAYATLEEAAQRLRRTNLRLSSELALRLARSGMRQRADGKWMWKFDPLHRTVAPQPFYSGQALEFFRRIKCPVLLVTGKESRQPPRTDMQQRLEAIRHRTLVEVEEAGHMIHHDHPGRL
ncbi:MAG: alpha/beta fold hydrolase, partial [Candidatus Binatia bacterium]